MFKMKFIKILMLCIKVRRCGMGTNETILNPIHHA